MPKIKRLTVVALMVIIIITGLVVSISFSLGLGIACENVLILLAYPALCSSGVVLTILTSFLLKLEKGKRIKRLYHICIASVILMFVSILVGTIRDDIIFELRAADYDRVIEMVEVKEIRADWNVYAKLPRRYGYLTACNREIAIERDEDVTKVLFFTYRGIMGEIQGYLYRSDGLPQNDDFQGVGAGGMNYVQKRPNWFKIYRD